MNNFLPINATKNLNIQGGVLFPFTSEKTSVQKFLKLTQRSTRSFGLTTKAEKEAGFLIKLHRVGAAIYEGGFDVNKDLGEKAKAIGLGYSTANKIVMMANKGTFLVSVIDGVNCFSSSLISQAFAIYKAHGKSYINARPEVLKTVEDYTSALETFSSLEWSPGFTSACLEPVAMIGTLNLVKKMKERPSVASFYNDGCFMSVTKQTKAGIGLTERFEQRLAREQYNAVDFLWNFNNGIMSAIDDFNFFYDQFGDLVNKLYDLVLADEKASAAAHKPAARVKVKTKKAS